FATQAYCLGNPGGSPNRPIAQRRIYQTKEPHAFALANKLLGNLVAHPAGKAVTCEKIGSVRLNPPDFGNVLGSHGLNRTCNAALSIQRRWMHFKYRTIAL